MNVNTSRNGVFHFDSNNIGNGLGVCLCVCVRWLVRRIEESNWLWSNGWKKGEKMNEWKRTPDRTRKTNILLFGKLCVCVCVPEHGIRGRGQCSGECNSIAPFVADIAEHFGIEVHALALPFTQSVTCSAMHRILNKLKLFEMDSIRFVIFFRVSGRRKFSNIEQNVKWFVSLTFSISLLRSCGMQTATCYAAREFGIFSTTTHGHTANTKRPTFVFLFLNSIQLDTFGSGNSRFGFCFSLPTIRYAILSFSLYLFRLSFLFDFRLYHSCPIADGMKVTIVRFHSGFYFFILLMERFLPQNTIPVRTIFTICFVKAIWMRWIQWRPSVALRSSFFLGFNTTQYTRSRTCNTTTYTYIL